MSNTIRISQERSIWYYMKAIMGYYAKARGKPKYLPKQTKQSRRQVREPSWLVRKWCCDRGVAVRTLYGLGERSIARLCDDDSLMYDILAAGVHCGSLVTWDTRRYNVENMYVHSNKACGEEQWAHWAIPFSWSISSCGGNDSLMSFDQKVYSHSLVTWQIIQDDSSLGTQETFYDLQEWSTATILPLHNRLTSKVHFSHNLR